MSYYYNSFTYKNINSLKDKGLIIVAFEPDNGFVDSFLSMDSIQEDTFDNTSKFDYGAKYNTSATINITMIKCNGENLTLSEFRSIAKWLTGARLNSWLDVYVSHDKPIFSFLGKVTDLQQYKMDAKTVGIMITFTSISPWAYSPLQNFEYEFREKLFLNEAGYLYAVNENDSELSIDENGIAFHDPQAGGSELCITDEGIVYIDNVVTTTLDNQSDDLYTYVNLDTKYENIKSNILSINNTTLDEQTIVNNLSENEIVTLSAGQFIVSDNQSKIFGDDFNFIWPRLAPGINVIIIRAESGKIYLTYRYPMKVGDCTMDIRAYSDDICNCYGNINWNAINWEDITNLPNTLGGYGITDAYTTTEIDDKLKDVNAFGNISFINGGTSVDVLDE